MVGVVRRLLLRRLLVLQVLLRRRGLVVEARLQLGSPLQKRRPSVPGILCHTRCKRLLRAVGLRGCEYSRR